MGTENFYKGISHIIHVSTNISTNCEHCSFAIGGDDFPKSVNHYIEQHGYKLLHVGTETSTDTDGKPWHSSIALLGK